MGFHHGLVITHRLSKEREQEEAGFVQSKKVRHWLTTQFS